MDRASVLFSESACDMQLESCAPKNSTRALALVKLEAPKHHRNEAAVDKVRQHDDPDCMRLCKACEISIDHCRIELDQENCHHRRKTMDRSREPHHDVVLKVDLAACISI